MGVHRRRKRGLLSAMLAFQMVLLNLAVPAVAYADESNPIKPPKKIVSIVYDDSGSMGNGNRYRDVNYAVQVFAALLNEQDEMYITFMNQSKEKEPLSVQLDGNINESLEDIRTNYLKAAGGRTPPLSLTEANKKLTESKDLESQKWLVVFTDGDPLPNNGDEVKTFEEGFRQAYESYNKDDIENYFRYYVRIGNATKPLSVQQGDEAFQKDRFIEKEIGDNEIIEGMKDMASEISGKMTFADGGGSGNRIQWQSDKVAEVHSDIPMYSVTVFSQGSEAEVAEVEDVSSQTLLQVGRKVKIEVKDGSFLRSGSTVQITDEKNDIIPAGDYTITFDKSVISENVVLMYEPAIMLGLDFYRNSSSGKMRLEDPDDIRIGDKITAKAYLADAYGKKLTDEQVQSLDANWKVQYILDDQVKEEADAGEMTIESIQKGQNEIKCVMELDHYLPQTKSSGLFEPKAAVLGVKAQVRKDGTELEASELAGLSWEDKIDIKLILVNEASGEEIPASEWPEGLVWSIDYSLDGKRIDHSDTNELSGVSVGKGVNLAEYSMNYPDLELPAEGNLQFEIIEFGIREDWDHGVYSSRTFRKNALEDGQPITFRVTANDRVLSADKLEGKTLEIVTCEVDESDLGKLTNLLSFFQAKPVLEVCDDGAMVLTLKGAPIPRFLTKAGVYRMRLALQEYPEIYAECEYEVAGDWPNPLAVLLFLVVAAYLTVLKMKAKFAGQYFTVRVYQANPDGTGKELKAQKNEVRLNWYTGKVWWPFGPASKSIEGFKIIANGAGGVYITRKLIMGYQAYGTSSYDPVEDFYDLLELLKPTVSEEDKNRIPETVALGSQPFYLKSNRKLYQLTLHS